MEALRRTSATLRPRPRLGKRRHETAQGVGRPKEMLMPIAGKKPAKKATAKKSACDCGSIDETALKAWGAGSNLFLSGRRQADGPDVQWESLRKGIDAYR